jgi:hypothetical protein
LQGLPVPLEVVPLSEPATAPTAPSQPPRSRAAARSGPGNGGIPVFQGNWLGSPLVVYANPFAGQVTAVQVGTFDFLYQDNSLVGVRLL